MPKITSRPESISWFLFKFRDLFLDFGKTICALRQYLRICAHYVFAFGDSTWKINSRAKFRTKKTYIVSCFSANLPAFEMLRRNLPHWLFSAAAVCPCVRTWRASKDPSPGQSPRRARRRTPWRVDGPAPVPGSSGDEGFDRLSSWKSLMENSKTWCLNLWDLILPKNVFGQCVKKSLNQNLISYEI